MTDNNGNLKKQDVYVPLNDQLQNAPYTMWWQGYDYDSLNRLWWVHEHTGNTALDSRQEYFYDRYGNRSIEQDVTKSYGSGINKKNFTVSTANNRLGVPVGQTGTMTYDAAGNLTTDTYSGWGVTRAYDAENRMTSETQASSYLAGVYTYNADGQRVRRKIGGVETRQVYGMDGELLAEYAASGLPASPQKEYGYRNGQLLVTAEAAGAQNVSWQNAVGVSIAGNSLTKTGATGWNAGAASTQTIASGDGYVEFTASETNKHRRIGLSLGNANQSWDDIDFCIYLNADGTVYINEGATARGTFGAYATGDVMRVAVEGGVVKYRKNGTLLYTSTVAPAYPLLVDTSFYTTASTINNVLIFSAATNTSANINWLVADHLGTPRMVFDKTGALATTKRHDYLPFGEELLEGQGLRTAALGYAGDNSRFKYTSYERDGETGLDYAQARYYASAQGRFTSVDPLRGSGIQHTPQSWNRYTYCLGNPLYYVDPSGMQWVHDTEKDLYVWVNDDDYKEGNDYFDNFDRYRPLSQDEIGPNGTTFTLTRGSYTEKYSELSGQEVFLGEDGKLHAVENSSEILFNPTKLFSATLGFANTGRKLGTGVTKLSVAFGVEVGTGTLATLPAVVVGAWGAWDIYGATAAFNRANQQWNEALNEKGSNASWKNLYGPLPYGQLYDDPSEPSARQFWNQKRKDFYQRPLEFIREVGSAMP